MKGLICCIILVGIDSMIDGNTYVIIANGPFLARTIIQEIIKDKIILALDGAVNQLLHWQMQPDIVLGDFDSIYADNFQAIQPSCQIIYTPDQNNTDLEKAIAYCDQLDSVKAIHIMCATGGRMDHDYHHMRLLQALYDPQRPIFLHTEYQSIFFVRDYNYIKIKGQQGDYCGIFGAPRAHMRCHYGLAYGNEADYFLYAGHESSSNQIIGDKGACIDIVGEALIMHPPMYKTQRQFFELPRVEQLRLLLQDAC